MRIVPTTLREANAFVAAHHRHHGGRRAHRFSIGLQSEGELVGVAIAGNPVAKALCDGFTIEVSRTCTDGTKNANSMLYGAIWRAARAMGYTRMITYTTLEESGASLRAVGMSEDGITNGDSWDHPGRRRPKAIHPLGPKIRWVLHAAAVRMAA